MRLPLLIAVALALVAVCSAPVVRSAPGVPQALAAVATECGSDGDAEEAGVDEPASGGGDETDEDAPPKFTKAFYKKTFTIDASTDGFESPELPVSIEAVCAVPSRFTKQAAQLEGADGIAVVSAGTRVWKDNLLLSAADRTAQVDGADTASLRVRVLQPKNWRENEDGDRVTTFRVFRLEITD